MPPTNPHTNRYFLLVPHEPTTQQDAKIVDSACLALTRIAEAFARRCGELLLLFCCGWAAGGVAGNHQISGAPLLRRTPAHAALPRLPCHPGATCSPEHLEALCNLGLISSIVQMVGVSEAGSMTSQLQVCE